MVVTAEYITVATTEEITGQGFTEGGNERGLPKCL